MKAPSDTRPTWLNGIIQIHVTRACDLACVNCTQGSNLGGKPKFISLTNFEQACKSLKDYYGVIGVFGGNPCVHPKFPQLCEIIADIIPYRQRGLWSNNLRGYGSLCRKTFNPAVSNLNVHTNKSVYAEMKRDWPECSPIGLDDSRHSPVYVAMKDIEDLTEKEKWELIEKCDINQLWSAMICEFRGELRGFFCEIAGAQSILHEDEKDYPDTGLPVLNGWWKLPIEYFDHQIKKHCMDCGVPLKGFGDLAVTGVNEFTSKTHEKIYKLKKPTGKTLHFVKSKTELGRMLNRSTDYISNGGIMSEAKILIGVPTAGFSRNDQFYDYWNMLDKPAGTMCIFARGQSPARNRNIMIEQALEYNCSHILFIDDDCAPPRDILNNLLRHDKDIVTGLYLMRAYPHQPIIFDYSDVDGRCRWHCLNGDNPDLVEIINCGLGSCLIKTDVFRNMEKPWIRLGELEKDHWCDDISFFNRARAKGYKLYCDLSVQVGHFTNMTVIPAYIDGHWHVTYDTNGVNKVSFPMPQFKYDEDVPNGISGKD